MCNSIDFRIYRSTRHCSKWKWKCELVITCIKRIKRNYSQTVTNVILKLWRRLQSSFFLWWKNMCKPLKLINKTVSLLSLERQGSVHWPFFFVGDVLGGKTILNYSTCLVFIYNHALTSYGDRRSSLTITLYITEISDRDMCGSLCFRLSFSTVFTVKKSKSSELLIILFMMNSIESYLIL